MPRLIYLANARLPTEKAHGLQIVQMCEAFSRAGYEVTLAVPARRNQPGLRSQDVHAFYGVAPIFDIVRLWALDLGGSAGFTRAIFRLQSITFFASLLLWLTSQPRAAIIYSRDQFLLWLVGLLFPRRPAVYEAHTASASRIGRSIQRTVIRRATLALAVTRHLADQLAALAGRPVLIEPDGIRTERFANLPSQAESRERLGLPRGAFIACYVGRLTTMRMDKGLGTVIEAFARTQAEEPDWAGHLLIVGGPQEMVDELRADWLRRGLPVERFHAPGQVAAPEVPVYLAAGDVCLMPQPWTRFFAFYTSPLKLFEYMAAGRPILASDLPSFREVLAEGENALFAPPSDAAALASALRRLAGDPGLRQRLGDRNRQAAQSFTWQARAERIRTALEKVYPTASR